ncbi:MAG: hypothetical protein OHK0038_03840 [Flammeovirgaceae bacterium]
MSMNKFIVKILLFLLIVGLSTSCSESQLSEEKPYGVIAARFRDAQIAQNMVDRLQNEGVNAYLMGQKTQHDGKWYFLILGASDRLDEITAYKIECEDVHRLDNLDLINYNKLKANIFDLKADFEKRPFLPAKKPALPDEIWDILEKLPYHQNLSVKKLAIYNSQAANKLLELAYMDEEVPDIPRGMLPSQLLAEASGMTEVVYTDPLKKREYTLHFIKMKEGNETGKELIKNYAQNILDTRHYEKEEKTDVAFGGYEGYAITLVPSEKVIKRYFLLTDDDQEEVILIQSSSQQFQDLQFLAEGLDQTKNILEYQSVYNQLYLLPSQIDSTDVFAYFKLDKNMDSQGKYASYFYGQYTSKTLFRHRPTGTVWEARIAQLNDEKVAEKLWQTLYVRDGKEKDSLNIGEISGLVRQQRLWNKDTKSYEDYASEMQLQQGEYIARFFNHKGQLGEGQLKKRTNSYQWDAVRNREDWWFALTNF